MIREYLNKINNKNLIKLTENVDFMYTEEYVKISSPTDMYYMKWDDLSLNITINLKWSLFAFFFMNSIKETLDDPKYTLNCEFIDDFFLKNYRKKIFINNEEIDSLNDLKRLMECRYGDETFHKNTILNFKLTLTAKEFIIIQNAMFPHLIV